MSMIVSNVRYAVVLCDEFQLKSTRVSLVGEAETCCNMCKYMA